MKPTVATGNALLEQPAVLSRAIRLGFIWGAITLAAVVSVPKISLADEGGVSFWLPGLYGSLAAVPQGAPGWSFFTFQYYTNVSAGAAVSTAREIQIGGATVTNLNLSASLHAQADLQWVQPNYAFATPIFGGQLTVGLGEFVGWQNANLAGTLSGTVLGGPSGAVSGSITNSVAGFGDMYPSAALKWHDGVNNYMIYGTGDIPVGAYELDALGESRHRARRGRRWCRLYVSQSANRARIHGSRRPHLQFDKSEHELSEWRRLPLGLGSFAVSSKQVFVGPVGYVYDQLSCDSGSGDRVGCFKSRVLGIGPQIGYLFPIGNMQGYLNLKAYGELTGQIGLPAGMHGSRFQSRRQHQRRQRHGARWSTSEATSLTSIDEPPVAVKETAPSWP